MARNRTRSRRSVADLWITLTAAAHRRTPGRPTNPRPSGPYAVRPTTYHLDGSSIRVPSAVYSVVVSGSSPWATRVRPAGAQIARDRGVGDLARGDAVAEDRGELWQAGPSGLWARPMRTGLAASASSTRRPGRARPAAWRRCRRGAGGRRARTGGGRRAYRRWRRRGRCAGSRRPPCRPRRAGGTSARPPGSARRARSRAAPARSAPITRGKRSARKRVWVPLPQPRSTRGRPGVVTCGSNRARWTAAVSSGPASQKTAPGSSGASRQKPFPGLPVPTRHAHAQLPGTATPARRSGGPDRSTAPGIAQTSTVRVPSPLVQITRAPTRPARPLTPGSPPPLTQPLGTSAAGSAPPRQRQLEPHRLARARPAGPPLARQGRSGRAARGRTRPWAPRSSRVGRVWSSS